jgi:hypothetical protein
VIGLALALQVAAAASQTAPHPAPSANVAPPVVVTAPALKDVPALVHGFGRRPEGVERLARWQVPLCPAVIGPPPDQAAYVVRRLYAAAKTVGLPVGYRGCAPNLVVVLTPDVDAITAAIARRRSAVLGPRSSLSQYSAERARFVQHDAKPYHEFVLTQEVLASHGTHDGEPLQIDSLNDSSASLEGSGLSFSGLNGPPVIDHAPDSYMTPDVDDSFSRLVLVIDQNRLKGLSLQQVSAYVLMLSLAEVDETADKGVQTILQVADPDVPAKDKPQDLTFWDRAYLGALYHAATQKSLGLQEGVMEADIAHAVETQTILPRQVGLEPPPTPAP